MSDEKLSDWRNYPVTKQCRRCGSNFEGKYNSSTCSSCKVAVRAKVSTEFKKNNPSYWLDWAKTDAGKSCRKRVIARSYSTTVERIDEIRDEQGGGCAICGKTHGWKANGGNLVIDHCHKESHVRGLLCPSCNRGLGQFLDDPEILRSAADYIERTKGKGGLAPP